MSAGPPTRTAVDSVADLAGRDLQAVGLHLDAAEVELIDEGVGLGEERARRVVEVLGQAHAGLQLGGHVGGHVQAVGVAAGEGEAEVAVALEVRILEEQVDLLLEQAVGAAQRGRLLAAEEVVAGDVGKHAGADAGLAVGIAAGAAGDEPPQLYCGVPVCASKPKP